jgi:biotin carboxyl carrier protein
VTFVEVEAQMTGSVLGIEKGVGDRAEQGEILLVLESMKMEVPLVAPCAGRVVQVNVEEGQSVEEGEVLVVLGD